MKNIILAFTVVIVSVFTSCNSNIKKDDSENLNGVHKVVVKEILQANAYTYLLVTENGTDQWIAVSKIDAEIGNIYYFEEFMEMFDFQSKDLGRTFNSVYFIQELRAELHNKMHDIKMENITMKKHDGKPALTQKEIVIDPVEGCISLSDLFANLEKYNGKLVSVKGKIVKLNNSIMNRNWFHIQDGTSANGNFDLTVTSIEAGAKVGDVVIFEGTIILNKDFGYGYSYEVLMVDGMIKK